MANSALILAYHAVERGPRPLCVDPDLFARQLDALVEADANTLTFDQAAAALRSGHVPERAVAITFDDGFASVIEHAVPALLERGMRATIFCVAGHLGGVSDWSSQPAWAIRRPLAGAEQLAEVAGLGFEIGAHGMEHMPLSEASDEELRREIVDSRERLEDIVGIEVTCFAYPYGDDPGPRARPLLERSYGAACGTRAERARTADDALMLPRVDAHYLRRPELLRRVASGGLEPYLGLRRRAAAIRQGLFPRVQGGVQKSPRAVAVVPER